MSLIIFAWLLGFVFPTLGYFRADCPSGVCDLSGYQSNAWAERFWENHPGSRGVLVDGYQRRPDPFIVWPALLFALSPIVLEVVFR